MGKKLGLCCGMAALAFGVWSSRPALAQSEPGACTQQNPCLTYTSSFGERSEENYYEDGRTNYRYETRITARIEGGDIVYDQTSYRNFDDPMTQALVTDAKRSLQASANGQGAGIVVTELRYVDEDYSEELEDSFTETSYYYEVKEEHSVQTTIGGAPNATVPTGYRGFCNDAGRSGTTNAAPFDGSFASCDGYESEHEVEAGYVNENTHSNTIYSSTTTSFTNTDYVVKQHYQLLGRLFLIGFVHPAVGQAAIEASSDLYQRMARQAEPGMFPAQGDAGGEAAMAMDHRFGRGLDGNTGSGAHIWGQAHAGSAGTANTGVHRGSERDSTGFSGGVHYYSESAWNFGVAFDYSATRIWENSGSEYGELEAAQFGFLAAYDPGKWFARGSAIYGFGNADTRQGNAVLGGISTASYSVDVTTVKAEAGLRLQLGTVEITPLAGIDWVNVQAGGFTGEGGFALGSGGSSVERSSTWADIGVSRTWQLDGGQLFRVHGGGRVSTILSGETIEIPVYFVANPSAITAVTGATEGKLAGEARLGLEFEPAPNIAFHAVVSGRWDDHGGDSQSIGGGLRIQW